MDCIISEKERGGLRCSLDMCSYRTVSCRFFFHRFKNPSIAGGRKAVARCFMYDCSLILFIIVMTCERFLDTGAHFIISVVSLTTSYNHRYPTIFDRPQADAGGTLKARKVWAIAPVIWA